MNPEHHNLLSTNICNITAACGTLYYIVFLFCIRQFSFIDDVMVYTYLVRPAERWRIIKMQFFAANENVCLNIGVHACIAQGNIKLVDPLRLREIILQNECAQASLHVSWSSQLSTHSKNLWSIVYTDTYMATRDISLNTLNTDV